MVGGDGNGTIAVGFLVALMALMASLPPLLGKGSGGYRGGGKTKVIRADLFVSWTNLPGLYSLLLLSAARGSGGG